MHRTWRLRTPDPDAVRAVAHGQRLHPLVATLLVNRGLADPEAAGQHLRAAPNDLHDPFLLPDMKAACERIARAIRDEETILVHGDYDVGRLDGRRIGRQSEVRKDPYDDGALHEPIYLMISLSIYSTTMHVNWPLSR